MTMSPMCRLVTRMVCPSRTPVRRPSRGSSVRASTAASDSPGCAAQPRGPRFAPRVADPRQALEPVTGRLVQVAEGVANTPRIHDPAPVEDVDDGLARGHELIVQASDDLDVGDWEVQPSQRLGEPAVRLSECAGGLLGEIFDDERILLTPRVQDGHVRDVARKMRPEAVGTRRDVEAGGQRDHAGEAIGKEQAGVPSREPAPRVPEGVHAVRIDVHAARDGVEDRRMLGHEWRLGGDVVLPVLGRGDDELARPPAQHAPYLVRPPVRRLARRVQRVDEGPCPIRPVALRQHERDLAGRARLRLHGHRGRPRRHLLEGHAAVQPVAQPRWTVVGVGSDASSERSPRAVVALAPIRADERDRVGLSVGRGRRAGAQPEHDDGRGRERGPHVRPREHEVTHRHHRAAGRTASLPPSRRASAPCDRSRSRASRAG